MQLSFAGMEANSILQCSLSLHSAIPEPGVFSSTENQASYTSKNVRKR